jgi:hypothetical protein
MTDQTDITLREAAQRLASARANVGALAVKVTEVRAAWEAAHADLLREHAEAAQDAAHADEILRKLAVVIHETTGEKSLGYGVSIATTEKLAYDQAAAVAWAKRTETLPVTETLDWKAFEKIAKSAGLAFVTKTVTPSVRIASDLDAALSAEAVAS